MRKIFHLYANMVRFYPFRKCVYVLGIFFLLTGCGFDDAPQLPSVDEREAEAIENLTALLTAPNNGWKLLYRPTSTSGAFLMLLTFDEDGTVRIQSDVSANEGEFTDHTINYRIDNAQGLELIFETYGVFHYLFELDQATFGGEFELIFSEEEGSDLVFFSKTDDEIGTDISVLTFTPATSSDESLLSFEVESFLSNGIFQTQDLGRIGLFGMFNFYLSESNVTLSTVFDFRNRIFHLLGGGVGESEAEIGMNEAILINSSSPFSLESDEIVLDAELSFTVSGERFSIDQLTLANQSSIVASFCVGKEETVYTASGSDPGNLGNYNVQSSLFQAANNFDDQTGFYSINYIFTYDELDNSVADTIAALVPEVVAFQWYFGLEADSTEIFDAVGFVTLDEANNTTFYLRKLEYTNVGNHYSFSFTGENFISDSTPDSTVVAGFEQAIDLIFESGEIYLLEVPTIEGLFEFYNPCNGYKGFLF